MATLKIFPIEVTTQGGHSAVVNGIDPTNSDCLHGSINSAGGTIPVRWDLHGIARNQSPGVNINMHIEELEALSELAKKLGAQP
ncbi:hypothetical protein [Segnochrobactrum spirostomi]|uniref:Uncharacterized protein n=1 Tax=Segnochrobactrum spirostomi TaxID=2608987 RepID=A0A6A7Y613_9HYPH|nr:hypothetical protein [Segnochrobactrum spirostomi]MQT13122.1 hypothetical protein [Segnochrobactrum spirostomi]